MDIQFCISNQSPHSIEQVLKMVYSLRTKLDYFSVKPFFQQEINE